MTGKDYRTVKKYVDKTDFNEKKHKAKRPNNSDILRPIISKWLEEDKYRHHKQRHTAVRVYERLQDEHPELLVVSERTVRNLVKEERAKIYGSDEAYLLLEHPGGEAQVDFGHFQAVENNSLVKLNYLILSFPKSNAGFAVVTRSETREALLEGLIVIFAHIGYVPSAIWFDQMSAAALRTKDDKGQIKLADMMQRFANHYGFKIKFCNPNKGNEKGNVENKVGTIRRNLFVPEPTIIDLDQFNHELLAKCDKRNQKKHYRQTELVAEIFEKEKAQMVPLNTLTFDASRYESRKVNKYGLVEFAKCRYSVSPKYVGESVGLRVRANEIQIYNKEFTELICIHPRLFGNNLESINYLNFIDTIKTRPRALKYTGLYSLLPDNWKEYIEGMDKETLKLAFDALKTILLEDDMDYAAKVLAETMKHNVVTPEAIKVTHKRLKEDIFIYREELTLPSHLPHYEVDTDQYDALMGGLRS